MVCVRACGTHFRGFDGGGWGLCGPVLGLGGKGFGLRRGGFRKVVVGFGVGQVRFAEWCFGCFRSGDCVRA